MTERITRREMVRRTALVGAGLAAFSVSVAAETISTRETNHKSVEAQQYTTNLTKLHIAASAFGTLAVLKGIGIGAHFKEIAEYLLNRDI